MDNINSVYIDNYKCFGTEVVGFEAIKRMNIIIGRNNTGKSSLLDLLSFITDPEIFIEDKNTFGKIIVGYKLDHELIKECFTSSTSGGSIQGNHYTYGVGFVDKILHIELEIGNNSFSDRKFLTGKYTIFNNDDFPSNQREHWDKLAKKIVQRINQYNVFRVGAERNIVPEDEKTELNLSPNGDGATNILHKFINLSTLDSKLVEHDLLKDLNNILYPDAFFKDIVVQQVLYGEEYKWEIFLEEEDKGRVPLSKSGSGLKTIILILIQLLLIPTVEKKEPSKIIYALEELENNLHPALQRNLYKFIFDWSKENNTTVFITTHSHIPINMFGVLEDVQIIHLRNNEDRIIPRIALDFQRSSEILDDLDVKASDLLQSNGIIWVEGPTDRMYLNKWIEVFSDGLLKEGQHYQIIYYGGRLLSHYAATEDDNELINVLLANRNCSILIDSDKRTRQSPINETKKRIKAEFESYNLHCWITKGKEIENYIPKSALENLYEKEIDETFEQYMDIKDFLNSIERGEGDKYQNGKVKFANKVIPHLEKEDLGNTLDLKTQINSLIEQIKSWNGLN